MADTALHVAETPTNPPLQEQLRSLSKRAGDMEDVLRGAQGVLHAIHSGGLLDSLPKDPEDHASHEAALAMLTLLERQVETTVDHGQDWDCSCELILLADKAERGTIRRLQP